MTSKNHNFLNSYPLHLTETIVSVLNQELMLPVTWNYNICHNWMPCNRHITR